MGSSDDLPLPHVPLQRAGKKIEMAHAALFLLSDACPYITGRFAGLLFVIIIWLYVFLKSE